VLKIHVVHEGNHDYYVQGLVPGRAEGTLVAGEEPGIWGGSAAATLGLAGYVEAKAFAEVMAGREPGSGRPLRARAGAGSVAAYDLSFCAPKSVSILHLLAPRELAGETGAGHRAAVADAVGYLERSALAVRRRYQGRDAMLPTAGGVAGGFLHRTSRALDPHLHTHLVVANVAQGVDGEWSALDSRRLHGHLQAAQGVYHARLRLELTTRLGASWEVGAVGLGDVEGVPLELRHLFSQRAADMAHFDYIRRGALGRRHGKWAFHATRPRKQAGHTVEDLLREWRGRAADFGYELGDLTRVVGLGAQGRDQPPIDLDQAMSRLDVAAFRRRPLARRDLVALLCASSRAGARAESVESLAASLTTAAGESLPPVGAAPGATWARDPRRQASGIARVEPRWRAADLGRALQEQGAEPARDPDHPPDGALRRERGRELGLEPGGPRSDRRVAGELEPEHRMLSLGRAR
jgi:conjugative relaxase-like TrwC/TraI family protein